MLLALTIVAGWAEDSADEADNRVRQLNRNGAIELGGGIASATAGVVVLLVGRGRPGQISNESQRTSDLKSFGGAALMIGGFTTAMVGGNEIGKARALRRQDEITVAASIDRGGGTLLLSATF